MTNLLLANATLKAGALEEVGTRSYRGPLAYYAFLRIGGEVYAPISATRRVDGFLDPGISDVRVLRWSGPHFVVALRRPDGTTINDTSEVLRRCRQFALGRLLITFGLAIFPGLLLTPLGTAAIAGYGLFRYSKRRKSLRTGCVTAGLGG